MAALFVALVALQLGGTAADRQIDADSAGFILLIGDLLGGRTTLADWQLGTHLYLFPDALETALALLLEAVGVPLHVAVSALFAVAHLVALAWAWSVTFERRYFASLHFAAFALTGAYLLSYLLLGGWFETEMMAHLLAPSTHQGAMLFSLILFGLTSQILEQPDPLASRQLPCAFVLVALVTMSDVLFLVWGVVPALAVIMAKGRGIPRRAALVFLTIALGGVLGATASMLTGAQSAIRADYVSSARIGLEASGRNAVSFLADGARFLTPSQGVLFYGNVLLWGGAVRGLWRGLRGRCTRFDQALVYVGATSAGALAGATVTGLFRGVETMRYIIPYVFFVHFVLAAAVVAPIERTRVGCWMATSIAAATALTSMLAAPLTRYEQLAKCLEERNLTSGAAHYWDANPLLLSTRGVRIMPLLPDGPAPFAWNTDRRRLNLRPVQFVITTVTLLPQIAYWGEPTVVTNCADRLIVEFAGGESHRR